jgi:hypothetical protein
MSNVLLFPPVFLKQNSYIDNNVDEKILTILIKKAQDMFIIPLIGSNMFNDIASQVAVAFVSSGSPVTADYRDLLDNYIAPALTWYAMADSTFPLSYKFNNKNVGQKSSDNTQPASKRDLDLLKQGFLNDAQWYGTRLRDHCRAHIDLFPKWMQSSINPLEDIKPVYSPYQSGMALGNSYRYRYKIPGSILYQGKYGYCPEGYDPDNNYFGY